MTWLAILAVLKRVGTGVITWLSHRSFWQLMFGAALIFAGIQTVRLKAEQRHSAKVEAQLTKSEAARKADRQSYINAQVQAKDQNRADIQRTEQRQKEISDARVSDLNARLERITRELRDNPSAKGSAGRTPIPETGEAPCRAVDPAWLCLSPSDRLLAARNEERQDQLITWVIQQSAIDPNNGATATTR